MNEVYKQAVFFNLNKESYYGNRYTKYHELARLYESSEISHRGHYHSLAVF